MKFQRKLLLGFALMVVPVLLISVQAIWNNREERAALRALGESMARTRTYAELETVLFRQSRQVAPLADPLVHVGGPVPRLGLCYGQNSSKSAPAPDRWYYRPASVRHVSQIVTPKQLNNSGQKAQGGDVSTAPEQPCDMAQDRPNEEPVRLPIEDVLDLHTFVPKEIPSVVEEYIEQCRKAGILEVRLIHGKGTGTQREIVQRLLTRHPGVISFTDAPPEAGGWGATLVQMRPSDS